LRQKTRWHPPRSERGYNLVEVLIAMAMTGVVLMSVVTLFVFGQRNVYSGKQMTYAVSVGNRVLEDMALMGPEDIVTNFNVPTTTGGLSNNTIGGVTYNDSVVRNTSGTPTGYLLTWQGLVTADKLNNGLVSIVVTPVNPLTAGNPTTAQFFRISIVVQWNEGRRRRSAVFQTAKLQRA
jgi:type II secretory pathway pseudopilin PulG